MFETISSLLWCGVLVYFIRSVNLHIKTYMTIKVEKRLQETELNSIKAQFESVHAVMKDLRTDMNALRIDAAMKG